MTSGNSEIRYYVGAEYNINDSSRFHNVFLWRKSFTHICPMELGVSDFRQLGNHDSSRFHNDCLVLRFFILLNVLSWESIGFQ